MALNFLRTIFGINLKPQNTIPPSVDGDIRYNSSTDNLELYNGTIDPIVTSSKASSLITGLTNANLSGSAGITNSNLAAMPSVTFKGNITGGSATPVDLTAVQARNAMLPDQTGQSGNFLTTNGTNVSWASGGGGGGANTALSNLTTTAINQNLLFDTSATYNIGSLSTDINTLFAEGIVKGTTNGAPFFVHSADTAAATANVEIRSGNSSSFGSGDLDLFTGTAGAGGGPSGEISISSGNSSGSSGDIVLNIGTAVSTKGKIKFTDGSEGVSGYVWKSTDTAGSGSWQPSSGASPTQQIFTSGSGTYTTPVGVTLLKVSIVGAGGGGGGASSGVAGRSYGAGGGGGGATVVKWITAPSSTYAYLVGTGGTGGSAGANNGNPGTSTTFGTAFLNASGGTGGISSGSGTTATTIGGLGSAGGSGSGGDINIDGQDGTTATIFGALSVMAGAGGFSEFSSGSRVRTATSGNAAGFNGTGYGGGGGGGIDVNNSGSSAGGNGADGLIIVEEFY